MYEIPLPKTEDFPSGLRGLISTLLRYQELQRQYSSTPLAQKFWPDAKLQYVYRPTPNLYLGAAINGKPDFTLGALYNWKF